MTPPAPEVLLATTNGAKLRELEALLSDLPIRWKTPKELGVPSSIPETGS